MLDWDACRVFLEVARTHSFSAAGRALGLSQPTVGRRIAALEAAIGTRLVVRRARDLGLTADGEALLVEARRMEEAFVAGLRRARADADDADDDTPVRVSATEGLALHLVRRLVGARGVRLQLIVDNATVDLSRRVADIGVRLYRPQQPDLVVRRLGLLRFGLYAAPAYLASHGTPRRITDLAQHQLVRMAGPVLPPTERWLDEHAPEARTRLLVSSLLAQHEAARAGWGITAGARLVLARDPALRAVLPRIPLPTLEVWLAAHADVRRSVRVGRAWELLQRTLTHDLGAAD
jgi:DNA-binding transcriptional LysR family regulator